MSGKKSSITVLLLLLIVVVGPSCNRNIHYSENYSIRDGKWSMYHPAKYSCPVTDTVQTYDIQFSLRTSTDYPYRNLYLFVITTLPSGSIVNDTLNIMVTDEKGRWAGKGTGDLRELTIPYKSNIYFPEQGEYHFRVVQGMRDTLLRGVYDVGIKISRSE